MSSYYVVVLALLVSIILWTTSTSFVHASLLKGQPTLRIGARPSPLARIQAQAVVDRLSSVHSKTASSGTPSPITATVIPIQVTGDHLTSIATTSQDTQPVPLAVSAIDFTSALDQALLSHKIDVAVHSLKDLPPTGRWQHADQLQFMCHLPRDNSNDVLVGPYPTLRDLPLHAKAGTSSMRRQAQILALRPDLTLVHVRGNVQTRLDALTAGTVDALILAQAGLQRLLNSSNGKDFMMEHACHVIPSYDMLSAACQGIVSVVGRKGDTATQKMIEPLSDKDSSIAAAAERAFLDRMDSFSPSTYTLPTSRNHKTTIQWQGRPPLAALMEKQQQQQQEQDDSQGEAATWMFQGLLARPDGSKVIRESQELHETTLSVADAATIGTHVAEAILQKAGPGFYASP